MNGNASQLAVAVPAALAAAGTFGLSAALQHREARQVIQRDAVRAGLLVDLARKPAWSASLLCTLLGVVLQCVALATGPLVLVQSILVATLVFAVAFSALLRRRRPDRIVLLGATLCVLGLATFLGMAQPTGGRGTLTMGEALPLAAGLLIVVAACLGVASRAEDRTRTLALAAASGVLYGVAAGLAKLAAQAAEYGLLAMFTEWPVYLVVVCGPLGFLLTQNAFQAGVAMSPALASITVLEPLTAIGVGVLWLGERLRFDAAAAVGEFVALALLCVGVVVLSYRAPQTMRQQEREPAPEPEFV
jgi:drug/metabolite transporter (DMT)-like permease